MLKYVGIQAYSQPVALYSDLGRLSRSSRCRLRQRVQQRGMAQVVLILLISPHGDWTLLCEGSLTMTGGDFAPLLELRRSEGGWVRQPWLPFLFCYFSLPKRQRQEDGKAEETTALLSWFASLTEG